MENHTKLICDFLEIDYPENHTFDWNDLMTAVDKIEKMGVSVEIEARETTIYAKDIYLVSGHGDNRFEAVFKAILNYMFWFQQINYENYEK